MYRMSNPYKRRNDPEPSWEGPNSWEPGRDTRRPTDWAQHFTRKYQQQQEREYQHQQQVERGQAPGSNNRRDMKRKIKKEKGKDNQDYFIPPETLYKKIGSSESYNDHSTEPLYDWMTRLYPPLLSSKDEHNVKGVRPLRELAAMALAERAHNLTTSHLQSVQWNRMKDIWDYICAWRRDSFLVFQLFASTFYREETFKCHPSMSTAPLPKREVILKNTLPNATNHRVERLFANIRVTQFVNSLNSCNFINLTILEMSKPVQYDDLIYLTNLTNLTALRISRVADVPDAVISRWCAAIKTNKWTKLQMLSIPMISQDQFIKLTEVAQFCKLIYLEVQSKTIFNMEREWRNVDYDKWTMLKDQSLNDMSWGMKTQAFTRKYKIENHSIVAERDTIWLDFNVMNHNYMNHYNELESEFDQIWKMGEIMSYTQALVLKKKLEPQTVQHQVPGQQPNAVKNKPVLKKKKLIRDAKSFFDL